MLRFRIKIEGSNIVYNVSVTNGTSEKELRYLSPFTEYKLSITAGNVYGFGKESTVSFTTAEEGKLISIFPVKIPHFEFIHLMITSLYYVFTYIHYPTEYILVVFSFVVSNFSHFYFLTEAYQNQNLSLLAPSGPPRDVKVKAQNSSALDVSWEEPDEDKRNGIITNYTVCISHFKVGPCFKYYTTSRKSIIIANLNSCTKYSVRVLVSTRFGRENFSLNLERFTNGSKY